MFFFGRCGLLPPTLICLVIAYPFAYFLSTRRAAVRNVMLVFVMIRSGQISGAELRGE